MLVSEILASLVLALFGAGPLAANAPQGNLDQAPAPTVTIQRQEAVADEEVLEKSEEPQGDLVETKQETEKEEIPFQQIEQSDPTLVKGQTRIKQQGKSGIREKIYSVTYRNGEETEKTLISNEITVQPVDEITLVGAKSSTVTAPQTSGSGYINVDGDFIKSPGSDPAGASARCKDGTYSYSANRRGTCSGHGGVAQWL